MNRFDTWKLEIARSLPVKITPSFSALNEILGAKYEPVLYLGYQEVNGINHAVLAEQTVINGEETKNVVIIIVNEKPDIIDTSVVDIHRIIEGGGTLGGANVELTAIIPDKALEVFNNVLPNLKGSTITPIAFAGTKVEKGMEYIFIVIMDGKLKVMNINSTDNYISTDDIL